MSSAATTTAALARLEGMSVSELQAYHREVFGTPTASRHRTWLIRRIAWQVQARAEGGLTEQVQAKAAALAAGEQIRERRPRASTAAAAPTGPTKLVALPTARDPGLAPGQVLTRPWHGRTLRVVVHPDGFEHDGTVYRSLSAVATAITGTKWNGHVFFGLKPAPRRTA